MNCETYSVNLYTGLDGKCDIYNVSDIQDLIEKINKNYNKIKYKLVYNNDIIVENNIIINNNIYDNMDIIMIKITTIKDIIIELIELEPLYFETEMNKIFDRYNSNSGISINLKKLIFDKFNMIFQKDNKLLLDICIYINGIYFFETSPIDFIYDDKKRERHIIKGLSPKNIKQKWTTKDIINFFDIIFSNYDIYISK